MGVVEFLILLLALYVIVILIDLAVHSVIRKTLEGDLAGVKDALSSGGNPNEKDIHGLTPRAREESNRITSTL